MIQFSDSLKEAKRYLDKYKRLDAAIDAFFNDSGTRRAESGVSTAKLTSLFDRYKGNSDPISPWSYNRDEPCCVDPDGDTISTQGTVQFFTELGFKQDEEELDGKDDTPKLLSLAYELQSPRLGEWTKKCWTDGWKNIGRVLVPLPTGDIGPLTQIVHRCDTIDGMKTALTRLEAKLGSDPSYFRTVYNFTFNFARSEGQRSLGVCIFWPVCRP